MELIASIHALIIVTWKCLARWFVALKETWRNFKFLDLKIGIFLVEVWNLVNFHIFLSWKIWIYPFLWRPKIQFSDFWKLKILIFFFQFKPGIFPLTWNLKISSIFQALNFKNFWLPPKNHKKTTSPLSKFFHRPLLAHYCQTHIKILHKTRHNPLIHANHMWTSNLKSNFCCFSLVHMCCK